MNEKLNRFVNREDEIAEIEKLIGEWDALRIACVSGDGGIGKTRLLERVRELYPEDRQRRASRFLITRRIDFDAPELHITETLRRRIANELGEEHFAPHIDALLDWHKMEIAGISPTRLAEEGERVDHAFIECFGKVAETRRVVLLVDTIDQAQGTDAWECLLKLASQLHNTLIVLAGRNAAEIREDLVSKLGEDTVQLITLEPLKRSSAEEYLQHRQAQLKIPLDPDLTEKILTLAAGSPLLIDVALDWLVREVPMPWLLEKSLDEIETLSRAEWGEFEKALVSPIGELRTHLDYMLWIMALVWPLDKNMIARLTHWSSTQVDDVWQDASSLSFVRPLPGDRLMLHDVVREMILRHLRPEVELEREHQWFSNVAVYLNELRCELQNRLEELENAEQRARDSGDDREAWNLFVEQESTERALWTIDGQYLGYLMLLDPEEGLAAFIEAWQQATTRYRFSHRAVLISQIERFRDRLLLSPIQEYQIDLRRAQHFLDNAMYKQAEQLLHKMLQTFQDDPQRQVELLIQLGNVVIRLGRFTVGLSHFAQAAQTCRQHSLREQLVRALNALGWVHRLMGRFDKAAQHYRDALKLSLDLGDEWRQAWLMNNLGYVCALQRNRDAALRLCEQALGLWKKIDFKRGVGAVYSTLGEVSKEFDQLEDAVSYFSQALDIFESARDFEWLSSAYCGRGAAFWLMGELDKAKKDLEKARDIGLKRDRPIVLHRLAHVCLQEKNIGVARDLFEQSYQASRSAPDPFYELNSLGDLARIAVLEGCFDKRIDEFEKKFEIFKGRYRDIKYRLLEGLLLRYLGDLHLCAGHIEQAVHLYQEGLSLIAEAGSYEPYTITGQLADMEEITLPRLDTEIVAHLAGRLASFWTYKKYEETHPEALPFFARWKTWTVEGEGR